MAVDCQECYKLPTAITDRLMKKTEKEEQGFPHYKGLYIRLGKLKEKRRMIIS